jgi:hypothetical protein
VQYPNTQGCSCAVGARRVLWYSAGVPLQGQAALPDSKCHSLNIEAVKAKAFKSYTIEVNLHDSNEHKTCLYIYLYDY